MNELEHLRFATPEALYDAVADALRQELQAAAAPGRLILLPGGGTPQPIYERLIAAPPQLSPHVFLAPTDERHVPPEDAQSNLKTLRPLFEALQLPAERLAAPPLDRGLDESAQDFEQQLAGLIGRGVKPSTAWLGLGGDGHTCSLFAPEDVVSSRDLLALSVERSSPPHRISVGAKLLAQFERVRFIVVGPEKNEVVEQLLDSPESVTAGLAVQGAQHSAVWQA